MFISLGWIRGTLKHKLTEEVIEDNEQVRTQGRVSALSEFVAGR